MSGKRFQGDKAKRNGFYIALAVCLVAVGVAAWSTYDAVDGYMVSNDNTVETVKPEPENSESIKEDKDNKGTAENKPNANNPEDGEAIRRENSQSEVSKPEPSKPEENTKDNSKENEKDAKDAKDTAAEAEETEAEAQETWTEEYEETAADLIYEISEVMGYPVESGEISSSYSNGMPAYSATMKDWRIHAGTDFKADAGEPVMACANGIVLEVSQDTLLGNTMAIEHGDYVVYYCGLGESIEVSEGDIVSAGEIIGAVSGVPFETAEESHIHVEVKSDNVYMNPEDVLN